MARARGERILKGERIHQRKIYIVNEKDQSFTLEFARDGFLYSVFQVESKFEVMVFVKVGKPSKQCREQPTNLTHSQKKEESTGLACRAISARALRHLSQS